MVDDGFAVEPMKKMGKLRFVIADGATASAALGFAGIGAPAGGLAVLKQFFAHTPADTVLAYVVVVHLLPHQPSVAAGAGTCARI